MKKIAFGFKHLKTQTPLVVKAVYRTVFLLASIWEMAIQPNISGMMNDHTTVIVNKSVLMGCFTLYFICQHFGIKDIEDPNSLTKPQQDQQ